MLSLFNDIQGWWISNNLLVIVDNKGQKSISEQQLVLKLIPFFFIRRKQGKNFFYPAVSGKKKFSFQTSLTCRSSAMKFH